MSSCKKTQRSGGDAGATVSPTTSNVSISRTTEKSEKSVEDLLATTPAQNGNVAPNLRVNGYANVEVEQIFYKVSKYEKQNALMNIIRENDGKRILVFVEKKRNADFLAALLCERKLPTSSIHGDRVRRDRDLARKNFESGRHHILVATTVALDIKNVDIVVNYDLPKSADKYVHRMRAGCVSNRRKIVSFYDVDQDAGLVTDLSKILHQADRPIPDFLQGGSTATDHAV